MTITDPTVSIPFGHDKEAALIVSMNIGQPKQDPGEANSFVLLLLVIGTSDEDPYADVT